MVRWAFSAALAAFAAAGLAARCGPGSKCPEDAPCCSYNGVCGGGAAQCTSGCNPMFSYSTLSCVSNPICKDLDVPVPPSVYNHTKTFRPILTYNGDPSLAPFTFESGYLGAGPEGVLLEMTKGARSSISTTTYMVYGEATVKVRREPQDGIVSTFSLVSNVGDAALWQFSGNNGSRLNTNYFASGNESPIGREHNGGKDFSFGDFHTYGIRWYPDSLKFTLDGKVVRTVKRSKAHGKYPNTPARLQLTTWSTSDSSKEQVRKWAGMPSYDTESYKNNGFYALELSKLSVKCAEPSLANVSVNGVGPSPVAYYYTNANSGRRPSFALSRDNIHTLKDPSKDAPEGLPGYPDQNATGPHPNMWTGGGELTKQRHSGSHDDGDGVSNGIKIGIPVGIGAGIFAILVALAIVYYVRYRNKERKRRSMLERMYPVSQPPQSVDHSVALAPSEYPYPEYRAQQAQPQQQFVDYGTASSNEKADSVPEFTKEEDYYYQDPYGEVDATAGVPFDYDSEDDRSPPPQHYAGQGDVLRQTSERRRGGNRSERRSERRRLREELREAALGDNEGSFFRTRPERTDSISKPRRSIPRKEPPTQAAYSRGGALPDATD